MSNVMSSLNKLLAVVGGCAVGYKAYSSFTVTAETTKDDNHGIRKSSSFHNLHHLMDDKKKSNNNTVIDDSSSNLTQSQVRTKCKKAIRESKSFVSRFMVEKNIPGLVIGVSYKGHDVWVKGFGFSNLELANKCTPDTIMRIASISKSVTMLLVAKLVEEGKLDLDKSIYSYLKPEQFPQKTWDGKPVDITLRQLVSHLGGIRHYQKKRQNSSSDIPEFESQEYYLQKNFPDVYASLTLFKDDDLVSEPGTTFNYTTHGFTLISAVIQSVLPPGQDFGNYLINRVLRQDLGMYNTFLDQHDPLIRDRSNYYVINKNHVLTNAPFVDNSYKWAGGGLLSSVPDLLTFGRVMMYSYLGSSNGYLKKETVDQMWTPASVQGKTFYSNKFSRFFSYGMGWSVLRSNYGQNAARSTSSSAYSPPPPFATAAYHSGAAIGASSAILILPEEEVVVAVFCNLREVSLLELSCSVAQKFIRRIHSNKKTVYLTSNNKPIDNHLEEILTTEV